MTFTSLIDTTLTAKLTSAVGNHLLPERRKHSIFREPCSVADYTVLQRSGHTFRWWDNESLFTPLSLQDILTFLGHPEHDRQCRKPAHRLWDKECYISIEPPRRPSEVLFLNEQEKRTFGLQGVIRIFTYQPGENPALKILQEAFKLPAVTQLLVCAGNVPLNSTFFHYLLQQPFFHTGLDTEEDHQNFISAYHAPQ
ncbi:MAG TPA: hypothetical protein VJB87_01380 [Candidatus Nanoarchaeia archaeon]|nr:hypothetical protein [Candidatus Nanoarchaeia archaeon]